jgi:peptidoglycan/LPS O-acetylase OafA/YrhL
MAIDDTAAGAFGGASVRRYDLDWLRVIAFGLLIFYHIGMFYVTWDYHVKSVYAGPASEPAMLIVNPWRLALLFFISGVAIRFASDKAASNWSFFRSRLYRLGLPILMGMIVVVAPQSYFELRQDGVIESGYLAFWGNYLKLEQIYPMITPTWNHLWYVVYLLVYILLIAPFLLLMKRVAEGPAARALDRIAGGPVRLLLLIIVPFVIYELILTPHFPTTHDLVNDWANHAHRFTIFLLGYFAAKHMRFWDSARRALPLAAALVVVIGGGRFYLRAYHGDFYNSLFDGPVMTVALTLYAWAFIVMLFGLAQRFLNRPSKALTYFTGAVFCYYILHQTIIVSAGYYLTQMQLGAWPEFLILTAITIAGCAGGYELLRRVPGVRLWFGIRASKIAALAPALSAARFSLDGARE